MNVNAESALCLIYSQVRNMSPRLAERFNAGIHDCLKLGLVRYAPRRPTGYELTAAGKTAMSADILARLKATAPWPING
jgi:hypothetical protein